MRPLPLLPIVVLAALAPMAASDIITVGPPPADHAEIQAAIDAADPGDILLVEPGTYQAITVAKPLRILGSGAGTAMIQGLFTAGVTITDIGFGHELVLSGFEIEASVVGLPLSEPASMVVRDCDGTVVLHDLHSDDPISSGIGLLVEDSARVVLLASSILDAGTLGTSSLSALSFVGSTVWIADSQITGRSPTSTGISLPGADGLLAEASTVHVWRSSIHGADGSGGKPGLFIDPDGGAAVRADGSTLVFYGGPGSELIGGDGELGGIFGTNAVGGSAIVLSNASSAHVQDDIVVAGGFDGEGLVQAPPTDVDVSSSIAFDPLAFATLTSDVAQAAAGTGVTLTLEGSPSGVQLLWASLGSGPSLQLFGVEGIVFLDLGTLIGLGTYVLTPSGSFDVGLAVPNAPAFLGATLYMQSVEWTPARTSISNPALITVIS